MNAADITIRDAEAADLGALLDIYGHHVLHGLASFEETPPDPAEFRRRWEHIRERGLPYLVAVDGSDGGGAILGYSYAGAYRPRPAYRHSVENSVYVAPGVHGRGIGARLLARLIEECEGIASVRQMVAVIGDSGNSASIALHEKLGFRRVGTLRSVGFKHGRWVDSVLMQRSVGDGDDTLP